MYFKFKKIAKLHYKSPNFIKDYNYTAIVD